MEEGRRKCEKGDLRTLARLAFASRRCTNPRSQTNFSLSAGKVNDTRNLKRTIRILLLVMRNYLIFIVVATFHYAIAGHIDPSIPCRDNGTCIANLNTHNAFCQDGFCLCKSNSEVKNCSSLVMHNQSRNAGQQGYRSCKTNQDCPFSNALCNTTHSGCECQKDYVLSSNRTGCLKKADKIDFPCTDEKQCSTFPNTTCANGQCTCISGFHYSNDACYKSAAFGKACAQSQQCSLVEGAICNETQLCGCPAETIISADTKRCLPVAREISAECIEDTQCNMTFADSMCVDKTCQCRYRYHFESELNSCYLSKALDEDCGTSLDCYQEVDENDNASRKAVQCSENICVCAEDFYREGNRCASAGTNLLGSTMLYFGIPIFIRVASSWNL